LQIFNYITEKLRREHKGNQFKALSENNEEEYNRLEQQYIFLRTAKETTA
jgi:hypothetical protein